MLNKTPSFSKPKEIDFTVMGLDQKTSKVLNWTMYYFENCERLKESNFMESESVMVGCYFDSSKTIKKVEKPNVWKDA